MTQSDLLNQAAEALRNHDVAALDSLSNTVEHWLISRHDKDALQNVLGSMLEAADELSSSY